MYTFLRENAIEYDAAPANLDTPEMTDGEVMATQGEKILVKPNGGTWTCVGWCDHGAAHTTDTEMTVPAGNHGVELGHAYLVDGGEPCTCGNHGCMEAYCAASALTREGRRAMQAHPESMLAEKTGSDPAKITPKLVTDCAKAGDPAATAVFDNYIEHLSSACASIYNILDPEVLALGGGLSAAGPFLFDPLQDKVSKKCFYSTRGRLVPAVLGNEAGMIGAALLARDAAL